MTRDLKFDGLKFLMVFFVVLAHMKFNSYGIEIHNMIYSFHIPVFVFLSGYFTSINSSKKKRLSWLKRTIFLFVCAHLAHLFLSYILGNPFKWKYIITPGFTLWYLLSLIYWRFFIWKLTENAKGSIMLVASFLLIIVCGFVPLKEELSFQRTFAFLPFFILGFLFKKNHLMKKIERVPIWVSIVVVIMGLLAACFLPIYVPNLYYYSWKEAPIRLLLTFQGIILCLSIIRLSRICFLEYFSRFGQYTLWIYIGHSYLIVIGEKVILQYGLSLNVFQALIIAFIYCALFILIAKMYENRKDNNINQCLSSNSFRLPSDDESD